MEAPHSSNPIAQIWKYLLVQVVLVLPFPRNPFAAAMYIQTRDCGIACENSYCLCNNHKEKRRGRFIQKIFFPTEKKEFFSLERKKECSAPSNCLFKPGSSGRGGGVGNTFSWSLIPLEASLKLRSTCVEISLGFLNFPSGKGHAKNMARKKKNSLFYSLERHNWPHVLRKWGQLQTVSALWFQTDSEQDLSWIRSPECIEMCSGFWIL